VSLSLLIATNNKVGANTIQVCTRSTVELFDTRQIYAQMFVHRRGKFFIGPSCMYSSATQPIVVLLCHSKNISQWTYIYPPWNHSSYSCN